MREQKEQTEQAEGAQGDDEWMPDGVVESLMRADSVDVIGVAIAALAQPSPERGQVVVTKKDGIIVAVTRQDAEGRVLSVIAESQPSPAPELDYTHMSRRMLEELAKRGKCLVATADLERLTQERDAAQARVAELESQQPVAWVTETDPDITMGRGVNWFPKNVAKLPVGTKLYAAPVAQAGQVPDWVACAERLPESGEPVIVWCSGSNQAGVAWIRQGAWLMPEPQALGYESITHWTPLPAAPAQGE